MRIVGMLRVKNEARWIERVLQAMLSICEEIFVFDDHSEDGTPFLCASLPRVNVFDSPFFGLDEARDKNHLLEKVAEAAPDWVLHLDGDEELHPQDIERVRELCARTDADVFRVRVLYLWDRPDQVRVDRWYADYRRSSLFRFRPGLSFGSNGNGGNFHCGNVPLNAGRLVNSDVRLLHYGYMERADRVRKYEWYNAQKPVPEVEDGYRHMVVGDLFPADSRFVHAGPLELRPL